MAAVKKYVLILILVAAAVGAVFIISRPGKPAADNGFTALSIGRGELVETVTATGAVRPRKLYLVGTETSGRVVEVLADFNQEVVEGALLVRLDDRAALQKREQARLAAEAARAALEQAEIARDSAETALNREESRPAEVRRQSDLDLARSQHRAAGAAVKLAEVRLREAREAERLAELGLSLTRVRAPVPLERDGDAPGVGAVAVGEVPASGKRLFVVLERKVSVGQVIGPPLSAHLFTLAGDLDRVHVEALVAESDVHKVRPGMTAQLALTGAAEGTPPIEGRVTEVRLLPVAEQGAVYYKAVIDAPNSRDAAGGWLLRPGLTATVEIVCRRKADVWKVPSTAMTFQLDEAQQPPEARERLARWQPARPGEWKQLWVLDADGNPWPTFVRVGGVDAQGRPAIRDLQDQEVLEWDPELRPRPDAAQPATWPRVIIAAPPAGKKGLLSAPNIKI